MTMLPPDVQTYKRTPTFTDLTIPAGLRSDHSTKAGTWGLIHVEEGALRYLVTDSRRGPTDCVLTPATEPGIVEPTIEHKVEPIGPVRFYVEFFRTPG